MFVDSLHSLNANSTEPAACLLGASEPEVALSFFLVLSICFDEILAKFGTLFFKKNSDKALLLSNPGSPCKYLGLSQWKEDGLP